MKKLLFIVLFAISLASCDSGGSSPTSPLSEQVTCSRCNGTGNVGYYVCPKCKGMGQYHKDFDNRGSNPSFTGGKYKCRSHGCYCNITRSELEAAEKLRCSCGHPTTWHHD